MLLILPSIDPGRMHHFLRALSAGIFSNLGRTGSLVITLFFRNILNISLFVTSLNIISRKFRISHCIAAVSQPWLSLFCYDLKSQIISHNFNLINFLAVKCIYWVILLNKVGLLVAVENCIIVAFNLNSFPIFR